VFVFHAPPLDAVPKVSSPGGQALASLATLPKPPGTPSVSPKHALPPGWGANPCPGLPVDAGTRVTPTRRTPHLCQNLSLPKGEAAEPLCSPAGMRPLLTPTAVSPANPRAAAHRALNPQIPSWGQNAPKAEAMKERNLSCPVLALPGTALRAGRGGLTATSRYLEGGNTFDCECLVPG